MPRGGGFIYFVTTTTLHRHLYNHHKSSITDHCYLILLFSFYDSFSLFAWFDLHFIKLVTFIYNYWNTSVNDMLFTLVISIFRVDLILEVKFWFGWIRF